MSEEYLKSLLRYDRADRRTFTVEGGLMVTARPYREDLNEDFARIRKEIRHRHNIPEDAALEHEQLAELFCEACLEDWTFTDDAGKQVPVSEAYKIFTARDERTGKTLRASWRLFHLCAQPFINAASFQMTGDEISAKAEDLKNSLTFSTSKSPAEPKTVN